MYDLFFISNGEPNAMANWQRLKTRFIHAKHISGVIGIDAAHKKAALQANTTMFYTVDADNVVDDDWDFSFIPSAWDKNFLHLWYSRNPVNNLTYGYGGIKLWPKNSVLEYNRPWLDFTTSVGQLKIISTVISTTNFNSSVYETWKSAFREAVKLSNNVLLNADDLESLHRLNTWLTVANDVPYAEWALKGANDGVSWFKTINNHALINDFEKLKDLFNQIYSHS